MPINLVVIFPFVSHLVGSNLFSGNMLSVNDEICNLSLTLDTFNISIEIRITNWMTVTIRERESDRGMLCYFMQPFIHSLTHSGLYLPSRTKSCSANYKLLCDSHKQANTMTSLLSVVNLHWNCYRLEANMFDIRNEKKKPQNIFSPHFPTCTRLFSLCAN